MTNLLSELRQINSLNFASSKQAIEWIVDLSENNGYKITEINNTKPWGGYIRLDDSTANQFIGEFFNNLDPLEARLGNQKISLSPKFLLVNPESRLSWQYHKRRAERWNFITQGSYYKSEDKDNPGELHQANPGDEVQFKAGECHRLVGVYGEYTLVAEIWQHTDIKKPSDEQDIIRVHDDYKR